MFGCVAESTATRSGAVAAQCLALKTLAIGLGSAKTRVFVPIDATDLPVAGAVASFLRTVANEMPAYSFHRVAIPGWTPEIVERLAEVILSETEEDRHSDARRKSRGLALRLA